tara:strand:+ start:1080 stop:1484 length:405 start_codon:yes stop_codon:yes gene_type:complete
MFKEVPDGIVSAILRCGKQVVLNKKDGVFTTTNIDCVDPQGISLKAAINLEDVSFMEAVSDERVHRMRVLGSQMTQMAEIESVLRLNALVKQATDNGIIKPNDQSHVVPIPPKVVGKPEDTKKPSIVAVPAPGR